MDTHETHGSPRGETAPGWSELHDELDFDPRASQTGTLRWTRSPASAARARFERFDHMEFVADAPPCAASRRAASHTAQVRAWISRGAAFTLVLALAAAFGLVVERLR